uniref:Hypotheticial protein n=1 Tax=Strongyloides papillosus TaxID=174720 RepID=A0A0N5BFK8_STREA
MIDIILQKYSILILTILSIINAQFLCKIHGDCQKMNGCVINDFGSYCANECTNNGIMNGGCYINEVCRRVNDSEQKEAYVCISTSK